MAPCFRQRTGFVVDFDISVNVWPKFLLWFGDFDEIGKFACRDIAEARWLSSDGARLSQRNCVTVLNGLVRFNPYPHQNIICTAGPTDLGLISLWWWSRMVALDSSHSEVFPSFYPYLRTCKNGCRPRHLCTWRRGFSCANQGQACD